MQITDIEKVTTTYHRMSITDSPYIGYEDALEWEDSYTEYIHHSTDNWNIIMGESIETVYIGKDMLNNAFTNP